jgi:hypothetical protein
MTEPPVDPTTQSGDVRGNSRPDVDDLTVAPEEAEPRDSEGESE